MLKTKQIFERVEYGEYNSISSTLPKKITSLDTMINQFIEEEGITADRLIDIKYSCVLFNDTLQTFALVIYK